MATPISRTVEILRHRLAYLDRQDDSSRSPRALEYDRAEAAALRRAIEVMESQRVAIAGDDPVDVLRDLLHHIDEHRAIGQGADFKGFWAAYARGRGILAQLDG